MSLYEASWGSHIGLTCSSPPSPHPFSPYISPVTIASMGWALILCRPHFKVLYLVFSFHPHKNPMRDAASLGPSYRSMNWSLERLRDLSMSHRPWIVQPEFEQAHWLLPPNPCSMLPLFLAPGLQREEAKVGFWTTMKYSLPTYLTISLIV